MKTQAQMLMAVVVVLVGCDMGNDNDKTNTDGAMWNCMCEMVCDGTSLDEPIDKDFCADKHESPETVWENVANACYGGLLDAGCMPGEETGCACICEDLEQECNNE